MADPDLPSIGRCRCGELEIEVSARPMMTAACHCRGCQRMSSSAFSLTAMVPSKVFRIVKGEPVKGGAHGPELDHYFCPNCKTWMFTRLVGIDAFVNIRPTMFDHTAWSTPFIETMTRDKLPWVKIPAVFSFEEFPAPADVPKIAQAFATRS